MDVIAASGGTIKSIREWSTTFEVAEKCDVEVQVESLLDAHLCHSMLQISSGTLSSHGASNYVSNSETRNYRAVDLHTPGSTSPAIACQRAGIRKEKRMAYEVICKAMPSFVFGQ